MPRNVLITGCSSGFGFDAAKKFGELGDHVFATMRDYEGRNAPAAEALADYADAHDLHIDVLELDVTDDRSVHDAIEGLPAMDVVINNAGYGYLGIVESFTPDQFMAQLDLNVVGTHRVTKAVLPQMRAKGSGLIIQVSSIAGRLAIPGSGVYNASKWALEAVSEAMRLELGPLGIDVCIVEPGPFDTKFLENANDGDGAEDVSASYPHLNEFLAGFVGAMTEMMTDPEVPTDPAMVVDSFVELAGMRPGERPMRTLVGVGFGAEHVNAALEPIRQGVLEAQGIVGWDGAKR